MKSSLIRILLSWIQHRSYRTLLGVGALLGFIWSWILPLRRRLILDNLDRAFPDSTAQWRGRIRRNCQRHFATMGLELLWLRRMDEAWIARHVRMHDLDVVKGLMDQGRGLIGVGGHFGNWEIMGAATARTGVAVSYIVKRIHEAQLDEGINKARMSHGIEILYTREAARGVLKHFKRNRLVAFLSDQDAGSKGVFVPFFGSPASTRRGAAVYALRLGVPMVYVSCLRNADGLFDVRFREVPVDEGWKLCDEHVEALSARYTAMLEDEIRQHPGQWFWMHRRWKTQPAP